MWCLPCLKINNLDQPPNRLRTCIQVLLLCMNSPTPPTAHPDQPCKKHTTATNEAAVSTRPHTRLISCHQYL